LSSGTIWLVEYRLRPFLSNYISLPNYLYVQDIESKNICY